jgi:hypothetical protein
MTVERVDDDVRQARFAAEYTPRLHERIVRFATYKAFGITHLTGRYDPEFAKQLVADVVGDTWLGHRSWPPHVRLEQLLISIVHSRIGARMKHLSSFPRVDADTDANEREISDAFEAQRGAPDDAAIRVAAIIAELRALAAGDSHVLMMLDAWTAGAYERNAVLLRGELTPAQYHNAHRRLLRLVKQLPAAMP